jgi:uncharacterized protein YgiM (DUF1202 family)
MSIKSSAQTKSPLTNKLEKGTKISSKDLNQAKNFQMCTQSHNSKFSNKLPETYPKVVNNKFNSNSNNNNSSKIPLQNNKSPKNTWMCISLRLL